MTRDSDFKQVVRRRMAETGESYTSARSALLDEAYAAAHTEQERLVSRLFTAGRLARVPAKRKVRAAALLEIGYHVVAHRQGDGLASEAAAACVALAGQVGHRRVIAIIRPHNVASRRVAEKIGLAFDRETVKNDLAVVIHALDLSHG